MRFRHRDGSVVHLAYCTNVHPAEDVDGVMEQLGRYGEPIREALGVGRLGLGLWLSAEAATTLAADAAAIDRLRSELERRGLEVVTFNGFPYRGFQQPTVKRAVYRPDWTEPERLRYTLDLARILARLLPDDVARGSISTLPLAWREGWDRARRELAVRQFDVLAAGLRAIEAETGRSIRVGLEPEPGCVVETIGQAVDALADLDRDVIGVSLDACHLAVQFEEPARAVAALAAAGIQVVKLQAACALEVESPGRPEIEPMLATFAEPRFLHQVRERNGEVAGADDLADLLAGTASLPRRTPWRIHVHLPLHAELAPPIATTRPVLEDLLRVGFGGLTALTDHIEVETYTWPVLPTEVTAIAAGRGSSTARGSTPAPPAQRDPIVEGIAGELAWSRRQLTTIGLTELPA
jgi:sugar phosphate isomerase/epimerase